MFHRLAVDVVVLLVWVPRLDLWEGSRCAILQMFWWIILFIWSSFSPNTPQRSGSNAITSVPWFFRVISLDVSWFSFLKSIYSQFLKFKMFFGRPCKGSRSNQKGILFIENDSSTLFRKHYPSKTPTLLDRTLECFKENSTRGKSSSLSQKDPVRTFIGPVRPVNPRRNPTDLWNLPPVVLGEPWMVLYEVLQHRTSLKSFQAEPL